MLTNDKRITILCGHYGTGKTNVAVNLALAMAKTSEKVTVADLDIVNPYFRRGRKSPPPACASALCRR